MGLRYRKSIKLGAGFRINFSKSGVGYSWGVPGYRMTKTATGRTRRTYSIPGTGISHVEESKSPKNSRPNETVRDSLNDINSASTGNFQPAEYKELLKKISRRLVFNLISNVMIGFIILAMVVPVFFIVVGAGIAAKISSYTFFKIKLDYEFDEFGKEIYKNRIKTWHSLNENAAIWQVIKSGTVSNVKVNAGASTTIQRKSIRFLPDTPFYIKTNVMPLVVKLLREKIILLPDKILIQRGIDIGAISYDDLIIETSTIQFVESGRVPKDAKVIDYTWQYVNKNGSPDRRYNNNRKLPICLYGELCIKSARGLNVIIHCSNPDKFKVFSEKIMSINS